jgi:hypothetical protein
MNIILREVICTSRVRRLIERARRLHSVVDERTGG